MDQTQLLATLEDLISQWEHEVVEFKAANDEYSTDKIGQYFSALANESNLQGVEGAWLVFGIHDRSRSVVGTNYRQVHERLQSIKQQIGQATDPGVSFRGVYEVAHPNGRVVMFHIPASPQGMPIAWKGHYYARNGESLVPLDLIKLDTIRSQSGVSDWTSKIIADATLEHLDPKAVEIARTNFATKYANRVSAETVQNWSTAELLERVKLSRDGKLTRAALLLLGRAQSTHLLEPHPAQITWKLGGGDYAYEHFGPPFLLTTSEVFRRIGNTQLKIQPDDSLLPIEVSKYDRTVVLEALHNCVAHQDYARDARIIVTELEDRLVFENEGSFFEERPDVYVTDGGRTPRRYRNPYLTQAMAELNMIDTMGFGILRMFERQAKRSFPLPDYDLGDGMSVKLTVYGNLLDESYTKLLLKETDIPLSDVLALDRVQKARPIDDATTRRLRKNGLIEGRKPHLRVAAPGVRHAQDRATYILTKGQDDQFYEKLILDFISKWKSATRKNVDDLLISKLSDSLDDQQKANKVGNLLTSMRRRGLIENTGSRKSPKWQSSNRAG